MAKIPDYTALGGAPAPQPSTAVTQYNNVTAVSDATQALGLTGEKVVSDTQDMLNKADITNAVANQYMPQIRDLSNQYHSLSGKAAVDAYPQYEQQVQQLRAQVAGQLTGEAQRNFQAQVLPYEDRELGRAAAHAGDQAKVYATETNDAALNNHIFDYSSHILTSPEDAADDKILAFAQLEGYQKTMGIDPNSEIGQYQKNNVMAAFDKAQAGAVQKQFLALPPDQQVQVAHGWLPPTKAAVSAPAGSIRAALLGQESGNNDNAPTSVDGAVGKEQITPGTFAQYAKPGESIVNNADRAAVFDRMMQDYGTRYNNDPQRIAVAYFSGPGNVAPAGSATPWIKDTQDGNGKSVSSYVSDIDKRMGVQPTAPQDGKLDTNVTNPTFMGQPVPEEVAQKLTEAALSNKEHQDKMTKLADDANFQSTQQDFFTREHNNMTGQANGLTWADVQSSNLPVQGPGGKEWWQERINKGPDKTDPAVFNSLFQRANLPDSDPNKLTDPKELLGYVGKGITPENMQMIQKSMGDSEDMKQFWKQGHDQLSNSSAMNIDGEGERRAYNWRIATQNLIAAGQAKGIPLSQLIDPTSKDYVGNNVGQFQATLAEQSNNLADKIRGSMPATPLPADKTRRPGETAEEFVKRQGL